MRETVASEAVRSGSLGEVCGLSPPTSGVGRGSLRWRRPRGPCAAKVKPAGLLLADVSAYFLRATSGYDARGIEASEYHFPLI